MGGAGDWGVGEKERGSTINISSSSESIRAGRSLTSTLSSMPACLNVQGQHSESAVAAVAAVKGLKYNSGLQCLASYMFLSYNSL